MVTFWFFRSAIETTTARYLLSCVNFWGEFNIFQNKVSNNEYSLQLCRTKNVLMAKVILQISFNWHIWLVRYWYHYSIKHCGDCRLIIIKPSISKSILKSILQTQNIFCPKNIYSRYKIVPQNWLNDIHKYSKENHIALYEELKCEW